MRPRFLLFFFFCLLFFCGGDLATKDDLTKQKKEFQEELKKIKNDLLERQMNLGEEILSLQNKIEEISGNLSLQDYQSMQQGEKINLLEENLLALKKRNFEEFASLNKSLDTLQNALLRLKKKIEQLSSSQEKSSLSSKQDRERIEKKINIFLEEVTKENNRLRKRIAKLEKTVYLVGIYHTVKPGENVSLIAQKYKTSIAEIIKANKLEDPEILSVGQRLFIPKK